MLTPRQRAYLKGLANPISKRFLMGKEGADESFLDSLDKALEAHELIKVGLLQTAPTMPTKDVAKDLAQRLHADVVQTIGRVAVLYRRSKKNPRIVLP